MCCDRTSTPGMLAVDPRAACCNAGGTTSDQLYRLPEFGRSYEQGARYAIFVHQAVLAGTVLAALRPDELLELPALGQLPPVAVIAIIRRTCDRAAERWSPCATRNCCAMGRGRM